MTEQNLNFVSDVLPAVTGLVGALIGAAIGWRGAVSASRQAIELQSQSSLRATKGALTTEILHLREVLEINSRITSNTDYVSFFAGADPSKICPIYIGMAQFIGTLELENAQSIVKFYSSVLTLNLESLSEHSNNDVAVSKVELAKCVRLADEALRKLREEGS